MTLALIYEDTNKCDNDLYGGDECHMGRVEFALIDLADVYEGDAFHIAHLCSYHALPVLLECGADDGNDVRRTA